MLAAEEIVSGVWIRIFPKGRNFWGGFSKIFKITFRLMLLLLLICSLCGLVLASSELEQVQREKLCIK